MISETTRSLVGKQKEKTGEGGKMDKTSTGETDKINRQLSKRRRDKNWHNYKRQNVNIQASSMQGFMLR